MKRLPLALVAFSLALPVSANAATLKPCGKYDGGKISAKNVTCPTAKAVIKAFARNYSETRGFSCRMSFPVGGAVTECRKGNKLIVHSYQD